MHEIIYTRTTNHQEKRKFLILIYVIMNYLILKMMRAEVLKKLLKTIKPYQFEPEQ